MAVKIRLRRVGKVHVPYYRIVVTDSRTKRDGRFIEQIGKYHPKEDPSYIEVDSDRAQYWLGVGAQPSDPVRAILQKTGDWQKFKGEPAPEPLLQPKSRRNRDEAFNEALKEAGSQPKDDATTPKKKSAKKTASAAKAEDAEPKAETEAKAEPKAEPKAKAEPKPEPKAEPKAKAEPKPEPKAEPKAAPKAEPKAAPKAEADAGAKDAPAADAPADEAPTADSHPAPASEAGDDAPTS